MPVPQDYKKARKCYEKGAQMGDYNCFNKVGDILYYGWGFPVDYDAAFKYYLKESKSIPPGSRRRIQNGLRTKLRLAHRIEEVQL